MTRTAHLVTSTDVELLRSLARERSVVAASRAIGMSRDRAVYRLGRLARAFGGPVVRAARGGAHHGETVLTALGDRVVRGGFDSVELLDARPLAPVVRPNLLSGVYRGGPAPSIQVGPRLRLTVAFAAREGETVTVLLDPEAIVVGRQRFASSARNVLAGTVESVRREPGRLSRTLRVRLGGTTVRVAITEEPLKQLRLTPGARVVLYVKATALRRVAGRPTRGRLRS